MYFCGEKDGPTFPKSETVDDGRSIRLRVPVKTEAIMISELYPMTFDGGKTRQKSSEVDSATTSLTAEQSITELASSGDSQSVPDINQFHMASDSYDADIAALAHSHDEQQPASVSVMNRSCSLNDIQTFERTECSHPYALNQFIGIGTNLRQESLGTMDLVELNTLSMGCLSRLDSIDMNIGTFSHAIAGDLAPWVLNAAGRMLDDGGDVRGSLDDFYTIQNANGGLDSVMNDSLNNSPRKMQPSGGRFSLRQELSRQGNGIPDRPRGLIRTDSENTARNSMFMDFFQALPSGPGSGLVVLNAAEMNPLSLVLPQHQSTPLQRSQSALSSLPSDESSTISCEMSTNIDDKNSPSSSMYPSILTSTKSPTSTSTLLSFSRKKEFRICSSSELESKESVRSTSMNSAILDMGLNLHSHSTGSINMSSIFNGDSSTGLEGLGCMSIDDGTYPLGSNSEALRVSSSDWNDQWERQVVSSSSGLPTNSTNNENDIMGMAMGINQQNEDGQTVVGALEGFGENDEFMQYDFPASIDLLDNAYSNSVTRHPPTSPSQASLSQSKGSRENNPEMSFEQLQLFQHQQLKGETASIPTKTSANITTTNTAANGTVSTAPPVSSGTGVRDSQPSVPVVTRSNPPPTTGRNLKTGFKYANKQPVVKKDTVPPPATVILPASPSNIDPKKMRAVKKKPFIPTISAYVPSFAPCVGMTSGLAGSSNGHTLPLSTPVGNPTTTGGISDTVFHGFRRRSKLSEAELEDQRALEQGDGALLVARGRYKCGRCGQLKTNHVCEYYEDTSVCSTATQMAVNIIDPSTSMPWEGERFLVVGSKRSAGQLNGSDGTTGGVTTGTGEVGQSGTGSSDSSGINGSNGIGKGGIDGQDPGTNGGTGVVGEVAEGVAGGILLNSGRRIGMGLKLGLVHFSEDVDAEEEWRMSVQNSARKLHGTTDSPYDSIFQLRQALNPTFPVDFDSNTTTPSSSTPYIPTQTTPYIPINAEEVMSVLNALEERAEDSDGERDDGDEPVTFTHSNMHSMTTSLTASGMCSPLGTTSTSTSTISEQNFKATLASRAARSRRAS